MAVNKPHFYWPLTLSLSNCNIPFTMNGTQYNVNINPTTYLSPWDLRTAAQTALNGAGAGGTFTVTITSDGRFTITHSTTNFTLRYSSGVNRSNFAMGFATADVTSTSAATGLTGGQQMGAAWWPTVPLFQDVKSRLRLSDSMAVSLAGRAYLLRGAETEERDLTFKHLPPSQVFISSETGTDVNRAFERLWAPSASSRLRYFTDFSTDLVGTDWVLTQESIRKFQPKRMSTARELYEATLHLLAYVP